MAKRPRAVVRGAGDLATGVAVRLHKAGYAVVMTEIARPTVVRRTVSFAEAAFAGGAVVGGVEAVRVDGPDRTDEVRGLLADGRVPVVIDPGADIRVHLQPELFVDAVVAKRNLGTRRDFAPAVVALGPGFVAGEEVHAVVETMRGHDLGRVLYEGTALPNTGVPGLVEGHGSERVLRSPGKGTFEPLRYIGEQVSAGETVARVAGQDVVAQIGGVLRGLLHEGVEVTEGFKVGDVDPRAEQSHCFTISDKALAVAGGVLEAAGTLLGGYLVAPEESR